MQDNNNSLSYRTARGTIIIFLQNLIVGGFFPYLIFLRVSKIIKMKDFEIINIIFSARLNRPIALVAKIVLQ